MDEKIFVGEIEKCQTIELPAGLKLYRGSTRSNPRDDPDRKRITGVPSFAFEKDYALMYANPDPGIHPNHRKMVPGDRSVLFTATLNERCTVIVLPNVGETFNRANSRGAKCYWTFEKTELLPLARRVLNNKLIAGYIGASDISQAREVILDLELARITDVSVDFLHPAMGLAMSHQRRA